MKLIKLNEEKLKQISAGRVVRIRAGYWGVQETKRIEYWWELEKEEIRSYGGWIEDAKDGWIIVDNEDTECTIGPLDDIEIAENFDQFYHSLGSIVEIRQQKLKKLFRFLSRDFAF